MLSSLIPIQKWNKSRSNITPHKSDYYPSEEVVDDVTSDHQIRSDGIDLDYKPLSPNHLDLQHYIGEISEDPFDQPDSFNYLFPNRDFNKKQEICLGNLKLITKDLLFKINNENLLFGPLE